MKQQFRVPIIVSIILTSLLVLAGCGAQSTYTETFDAIGNWRIGNDSDVSGVIEDGVFKFSVSADSGFFWTTSGNNFQDGIYSVDARQMTGNPEMAGYGMMFRANDSADSFYLFQISSDGFVKISRCLAQCQGQNETILINDWWFDTTAIEQGLEITNILKVEANGGNLIFFINETEVGRVTDNLLDQGDIGLFVETLGTGGVDIEFDNFTVRPLE